MRVLVTRPEPDASQTAARLVALGHKPVVSPLLSIDYVEGPALSLDRVAAFVATSANGVRALARRTDRRDIALFAVGQQTASLALSSGFRLVHSANGDAAALAALVKRMSSPAQGAVLHAAGAEAEGKLAHDLAEAGFEVKTEILYHARAVSALPQQARSALDGRTLDAVLHFSYRSARTFRDVVTEGGLVEACRDLLMVCISAATAKSLEGFPHRELRVAAAPNQDALLACLL